MPIWYFCFIAGASAGLAGMGLGMAMGIAQDFTLTPVHAHLNLLGWVSMMLYGLYYRGAAQPVGRFAWSQVTTAASGFAAMSGGLWISLSPDGEAAKPVVIIGACLSIVSMAMFMAVLVRSSVYSARVWRYPSNMPSTVRQ